MATPSDLIRDKNRSTPFNIGRGIEMCGFNASEVYPLVEGLKGKVKNPQQVLNIILEWTGGQPFLTQKICKLIYVFLRIAVVNNSNTYLRYCCCHL